MSIDVQPGERPGKVAVATQEANGVHYPQYVVFGTKDSGDLSAIPVDDKGHMEVAIHEPRLPFGSIHTEKLTPIFQQDGVYGTNSNTQFLTTGRLIAGASSASITGANNLLTCSTGTTSYSFSSLQSKERLRYRPGQGVIGRFTALFSEPAANSILVAGFGTSEAGLFFGYNGTTFGILYSTGGIREIQTLTVTTASTTAENITITIGGTAYTVAVTNSGDVNKTAYEIATHSYTGWKAEQRGDDVVFLKDSVGDGGSTVEITTATSAVGSGAVTLDGVAATDTWIPQASWNGDKLDGTGASGVTLDPQKGNVFQIDIQYLGYGGIVFKVETSVNGNNPTFVTAHTINFPNTSTIVNISQPSFPFTLAAYSSGSTTDVSVSTASYAGCGGR